MLGIRTRRKSPVAEHSNSDVQTQLDHFLKRQFEEDIARIFDESIHPDVEIVCGKLKILTHACILKARSSNFYQVLQAILKLTIEREAFDELYSYISDLYTDCDIKEQEADIVKYLSNEINSKYLINKTYYELVPVEGIINKKDLSEQEILLNKLEKVLKNQVNKVEAKNSSIYDSTSISSHFPKRLCEEKCSSVLNNNQTEEKTIPTAHGSNYNSIVLFENFNTIGETNYSKGLLNVKEDKTEFTFSSDSLDTDEPSSCSEHLSTACNSLDSKNFSSSSFTASYLNVVDGTFRMENHYTSSDSGLDKSSVLDSINSQKDVTLSDISLTDTSNEPMEDSGFTVLIRSEQAKKLRPLPLHTPNASSSANGTSSDSEHTNIGCAKLKDDFINNTSKEEKQRQNEEIVVMESSSLSSETGSWESVFPPKAAEKHVCEKFINHERQWFNNVHINNASLEQIKTSEDTNTCLVQKSLFKSTSCFIDAASLVDEEGDTVQTIELGEKFIQIPSSSTKNDLSPNDCSEDNEDSLEEADKDPDSIQKDLSPTIFEMTPVTEDSLCANLLETSIENEPETKHAVVKGIPPDDQQSLEITNVIDSNTPHNSILSVKSDCVKQYQWEIYEKDNTRESVQPMRIRNLQKFNESSPIISGGSSIEDHLPHTGSYSSSPLTKRRVENIPIISGAFIPEPNLNDESKSSNCMVNMSTPKSDYDRNDKTNETFFVDLNSLPESTRDKDESNSESFNDKKNIFSLFIDIGQKTPLKKMPARMTTYFNSQSTSSGSNSLSKSYKSNKKTSLAISSSDCFTEHVKKLSTSVPNPNHTFETYELLCEDPSMTVSDIMATAKKITKPEKSFNVIKSSRNSKEKKIDIEIEKVNRKPRAKEKPAGETEDVFVKLSDLDRPNTSLLIPEEKVLDVRMTRSIPDNTHNLSMYRVISAFHSENALSLHRLFPQLERDLSRSMGGSLTSRTRSPLRLAESSMAGDTDHHTSDISEVSSIQSSVCRSGIESSTTEGTSQASSLIANCQSKLGQDLLRMFLEEIATDVIIEVSGRRINAHKCILASRCQYFAGILSGGWVESAGNVIILPTFSYDVVHFALCHIYSGVSVIPDTVSIVELATLTDMLGLEGLKEAIMFTIKAKYCHHFHKPCSVCIAGVLECFPLSSAYGLDDLYRKCLLWITKYFSQVWPTKAFATLPLELLDKCYQQHIVHLTVDNFVETVFGCGLTMASLQNSRWADTVERMCRRLLNALAHFAATKLVTIMTNTSSLPPDGPQCALQTLHDCVTTAIEWAQPGECCRAYAFLSSNVKEQSEQHSKPDLVTSGKDKRNLLMTYASTWTYQCERTLVRSAPRVVGTQEFKILPPELRKRLRQLGCIVFGVHSSPTAPSPERNIRSKPKVNKTQSARNLEIESTLLLAKQLPSSNNDLRRSTRSNPPQVRMTKAQEERAKYNMAKSQSQDRTTNKNSAARSFQNTKPKYLESKADKQNIQLPHSYARSESPLRNKARAQAMSQDSLTTTTSSRPCTAEPSTDSLSESQQSNKYATYTKVRHPAKRPDVVKMSPRSANSSGSGKTKIPVSVKSNHIDKYLGDKETKAHSVKCSPNTHMSRRLNNDHKISNSLMCPTKASSAKMVPKIVRDTPNKGSPQRKIVVEKNRLEELSDSRLKRSGTFLKEEPTFGDTTTNFDIDQ